MGASCPPEGPSWSCDRASVSLARRDPRADPRVTLEMARRSQGTEGGAGLAQGQQELVGESEAVSTLCPLLLVGRQNASVGTRPCWQLGEKSPPGAKGRQNARGSGKLPFIDTFSPLPFPPSSPTATVPLGRRAWPWPARAAGGTAGPLPPPACKLHDLHGNPQGAGRAFQS